LSIVCCIPVANFVKLLPAVSEGTAQTLGRYRIRELNTLELEVNASVMPLCGLFLRFVKAKQWHKFIEDI